MDLQEYKGDINFATDAWTSPNHYAYITVTAHFQHQGQPMAIVLDVIKVAQVMPQSFLVFIDSHILASHTQV
jgi:hypothetical protein